MKTIFNWLTMLAFQETKRRGMTMKKVLGLLFVLVSLLTSTVGTGLAEADKTMVDRDALTGVWIYSDESDPGVEGLLVLNEDGTAQLGLQDMTVDLQWALEGNLLSFIFPGESEAVFSMQAAVDGDRLILTEDTGAVNELTRSEGIPGAEPVEPDSEAEAFLGEWDMVLLSYGGETVERFAFNRDGTVETHSDVDGSDLVFRMRWRYEDGTLYFPLTSTYMMALGTSDGLMQVAFEGERIVLIEDLTLGDMVLIEDITLGDMGLGFPSRYVYVLTRPDNPLTEEELAALQGKYVAE